MSVKDVDNHKLMYHPDRISDWKNQHFCFPLHIEAGITNRCNHRCTYCTLDWINHKTDDINTETFLKMLEDAARIGVKSIYFAGEGEPTLHPDLDLFVKKAFSLGLKVSLSTNGSKMNRELAMKIIPYLSWIRFSVDAFRSDTYSKLHGVGEKELFKVLENIKECCDLVRGLKYIKDTDIIGPRCQIGVQAIFMPDNMMEIENLAHYCKSVGVHNIQIKPAHSHPKSSFKPGIFEFSHNELKNRLEKLNDDKFAVIVRVQSMERLTQERNYKACHAFDVYCLIDAYGNVTPCNVFYSDPEFIFGNINEKSLEEIWTSDRKKEIMNKISELKFSKCGDYRCRLDVMNRYLERVMHPEVNDEFI